LTHELRTPATAMRLLIEELRKDYDLLPAASQRAFLGMCEELQRLGDVVDASKNYLGAQSSLGEEEALSEVPSLNSWLTELIRPFGQGVALEPLAQDRSARINRYWTEL